MGVPVVGGLVPAVVVSHQEDDIRPGVGNLVGNLRVRRWGARCRQGPGDPGGSLDEMPARYRMAHGITPSAD